METLRVEGSLPRPARRGGRDDSVDDADAALIRRVAIAERRAMHILFSRHHLAVYRFVLQHLHDKTLAEDVTSEVFLDVWRHADRFEGRSAVLTWILAIARNKTFAAHPKPRIRFDWGGGAGAESVEGPGRHRLRRRTAIRSCASAWRGFRRNIAR